MQIARPINLRFGLPGGAAGLFVLTSGDVLNKTGIVKAKSTSEGVTGTLDCLLRVSEGQFPPGITLADCWSKGHLFVMTKS